MSAAAAVTSGLRLLGARLRGTPVLVAATLQLTQRCNLRCVYCSSPLRKTPELSTAQWLSIIDQLAALGCRRITVLGGEALLRADLVEVLTHARTVGISRVLTSNGLLVPQRRAVLRLLDTLVLSLDAPGPANDAVRGEGVFAAVETAIGIARAEGVPVKLNAVLSAVNAPHLDELLAFVDRHDLALTINVVRSGAPDLWKDAATIKPEDDELRRLLERLAEVAKTNPRLLFAPATYRYAARWGDFSRDR
jgi:MoaA/NifB/PqqE/SkfB family radical SAM enzyme